MSRSPTTTIRIDEAADDTLIAVAKRLGVSKASLIAGVATWAGRIEFVAGPADVLPIELRQAIDEAADDAAQRKADGAYRGSLARKRAEEPPVAIADWTLTDKDLAEVAAKLGRTVDDVKRLVAAFKLAMKDRPATPRWRPAFTAWAAKNAAAILA